MLRPDDGKQARFESHCCPRVISKEAILIFLTCRGKEPFPIDYSTSACVNTRSHGIQPYDHT